MLNLYQYLYNENTNDVSRIIISLAIILLAGFLLTRLTKLLKLPNVSAYIVAGIIIGPGVLGLVPDEIVQGMSFISDVALAFIAFGVGKFFKVETLKRTGWRVIVITLCQSLLAGALVTLAMQWIFHLGWSFSILLGAIATATAPASTMMTINQYHARGEYVDTLLQVVALDDVVCLLTFSAAMAVLTATSGGGSVGMTDILLPILYNLAALVLGFGCGFIASWVLKKRSADNRLVIIIAMLLAISGICSLFNVSPLLACMVFGAVYINFAKDKELYRQINTFTPPIMVMFFVMSGMKLGIDSIATAGLMGLVFFAVRIVGKYGGAYLGSLITKKSKRIRNYLGFALIPSAGVAIGLTSLASRILPQEIGALVTTIILSSSVLYEFIGPISAKFGLVKSGCINFNPPITEIEVPQPEPVVKPVISNIEEPFVLMTSPITQSVDEAAREAEKEDAIRSAEAAVNAEISLEAVESGETPPSGAAKEIKEEDGGNGEKA